MTSRASGETGRRARFRSVWSNPWRFESSLAHQHFHVFTMTLERSPVSYPDYNSLIFSRLFPDHCVDFSISSAAHIRRDQILEDVVTELASNPKTTRCISILSAWTTLSIAHTHHSPTLSSLANQHGLHIRTVQKELQRALLAIRKYAGHRVLARFCPTSPTNPLRQAIGLTCAYDAQMLLALEGQDPLDVDLSESWFESTRWGQLSTEYDPSQDTLLTRTGLRNSPVGELFFSCPLNSEESLHLIPLLRIGWNRYIDSFNPRSSRDS